MLYSAVAVLVLIPKWDENRGVCPVGGISPENDWWFTGRLSAHESPNEWESDGSDEYSSNLVIGGRKRTL